MIEKGVLHLDQNEFVGKKEEKKIERRERKEKEKERKMGGKEIQLLLVSIIRATRHSAGQEVS